MPERANQSKQNKTKYSAQSESQNSRKRIQTRNAPPATRNETTTVCRSSLANEKPITAQQQLSFLIFLRHHLKPNRIKTRCQEIYLLVGWIKDGLISVHHGEPSEHSKGSVSKLTDLPSTSMHTLLATNSMQ